MKIGTMISEIGFSNLPLLFRRAGLDFFILDAITEKFPGRS